jgi:DNA-binding MarR family transcriptional regulator
MKDEHIQAVRDFNRFFAELLGLLDKTYLKSAYSLAEARVLRELYILPNQTANSIQTTLSLDKGYLSRILESFEKKKLITRKKSDEDGRALLLNLTTLGKREFLKIDSATNKQVEQTFVNLTEKEYQLVIKSMTTIKTILDKN